VPGRLPSVIDLVCIPHEIESLARDGFDRGRLIVTHGGAAVGTVALGNVAPVRVRPEEGEGRDAEGVGEMNGPRVRRDEETGAG
jgi:hypothetical protein